MRQMTMQYVWVDGHRVERVTRAARAAGSEGLWKKLWDYGWGLLFVLAMTALSMFGPRMAYSKAAPAPVSVSAPAVHIVK
jgi:hypothetical protein